MTIIARSASKVYDGEPLERPTAAVRGLPADFTLEYTVEGSQTDAGSSPNRVTGYLIRNVWDEDVTEHFVSVETVDGTLTVMPAPLEVRTGSAEKAYDGTELTDAEAWILIRGAGETERENLAYAAEDNGGASALYGLQGTVRAYAANPATGETAEADVAAGQVLRVRLSGNGAGQNLELILEPMTAEEIPESLARFLAGRPELMEDLCRRMGWDPETVRTRASGAAPAGDAGETEEALIEETAQIRIETDSGSAASRGGAPLTPPEARITEIRAGEGITVQATGRRTETGTSDNTYEIDWGGENPANYTLTEGLGTLTVTECTHPSGKTETREATCVAEGEETFTCDVCGAVIRTALPVDPTHHTGNTEIVNRFGATCAAEGFTGNTFCADCGELLSRGTVINRNPGNHTGGTTVRNQRAATCAAEGYTGDTVCSGCGAVLSMGSVIPRSASHVGGTSVRGAVDADCTHRGYTGDTVCNGCGAVLQQGTYTPALGHEYTMSPAGMVYCIRCGRERD